jgi:hypothetical protein
VLQLELTSILSGHLFRVTHDFLSNLSKVVELLSGKMQELSPFVGVVDICTLLRCDLGFTSAFPGFHSFGINSPGFSSVPLGLLVALRWMSCRICEPSVSDERIFTPVDLDVQEVDG